MNRWKLTVAVIIFCWGILLTSDSSGESYTDAWIDGTHYLHEETLFLNQVLGHDDGAMLAPPLVDAGRQPVYKVGDDRDFYAIDMNDTDQYILQASARAVSDNAYIFVEDGKPAAANKIKSLLNSFDKIYDKIADELGPPPDSVDKDPRIHILIMDIRDKPQADGARVLGYFSSIDQYQNAALERWTNRRSNEAETLYIDYLSLNADRSKVEGVVAHEFTHMVHWAKDPGEHPWVNEGIAVYAESMMGYEVKSRISAFEESPDVSLLDWSGSIADYGAAYLFFAYVAERFGGTSAISSIVENRRRGTGGIEQALSMQGKAVSFQSLFSDWVIANYLDDPKLDDGIYGYNTLDIHLKPSEVEASYPITQKTSKVKPWSARYTEFNKDMDDTLSLTLYGDDGDDIVAQIIEFGNKIDVSSIKSGAEQSVTALIPPEGSRAVLVVTSQPRLISGDEYSDYTYSAEIPAVITPVDPTSRRRITTWGSIKYD